MQASKKRIGYIAPLAGAMIGLLGHQSAKATIVVDGTLDSDYGSALATQTINTGFGDSTVGDGTSAGGSELDAGYGRVQGSNLFVFLSGNLEQSTGTPNHLNIFIADGRSGQSSLAASGTPLSGANGLTFPSGFSATYAIDVNDYSNTMYVDTYDLVNNTNSYAGGISLTNGVGNGALNQNGNNLYAGFNNTNSAGVNGSSGTAASQAAADAVTTGFEFQIPLSTLGNPALGSSIQILADINGGNDGYLSNQFLGGLPVNSPDLGSPGSVNLNGQASAFAVVVPEPATAGLFVCATFGMLLGRRSRKTLTMCM